MATKNKKIEEGTVFLVPIRQGKHFAIGLVAAINRNIAIGYFFDLLVLEKDDLEKYLMIENLNVLIIKKFSSIALKKGDWFIIGRLKNWDKAKWPVPYFGRKDVLRPNIFWKIELNEQLEEISENRIEKEEFDLLPPSGLAGTIFLENLLSDLLLKK